MSQRETTVRDLKTLLNATLIVLLLATPFVVDHGYDKWKKIESDRRGQ